METRIDLYRLAHKLLRAKLFETTALAARTDFGDDGAARAATARTTDLVRWLDEHAAAEDAVIMPELERLAPELFAALRSEHARVDGAGREVAALARRLEGAAGAERASLGRRLHERLVELTALHLGHMAVEEADGTRTLWAHRTDAELHAMLDRIRATLSPERASAWLVAMLPAVSLPERVALLAPIRSSVPPRVLEDLLAPARAALGPEWERTAAAAGL